MSIKFGYLHFCIHCIHLAYVFKVKQCRWHVHINPISISSATNNNNTYNCLINFVLLFTAIIIESVDVWHCHDMSAKSVFSMLLVSTPPFKTHNQSKLNLASKQTTIRKSWKLIYQCEMLCQGKQWADGLQWWRHNVQWRISLNKVKFRIFPPQPSRACACITWNAVCRKYMYTSMHSLKWGECSMLRHSIY